LDTDAVVDDKECTTPESMTEVVEIKLFTIPEFAKKFEILPVDEVRLSNTAVEAVRACTASALTDDDAVLRFCTERDWMDAVVAERVSRDDVVATRLLMKALDAVTFCAPRFWMEDVVEDKLLTVAEVAVIPSTISCEMDEVVDDSEAITPEAAVMFWTPRVAMVEVVDVSLSTTPTAAVTFWTPRVLIEDVVDVSLSTTPTAAVMF
jgi:hypothetical protein